MKNKKLLFVINPKAGQKRAAPRLADIVRAFSDCGWDSEVYVTNAPADATAKVAERAGEFDRIIASGGDGTLSEVICGVLKSGTDVPVGYIPAGTTNDFAATLGLSNDLITAALDAVTGDVRPFDVGQFNEHNFIYIASFGAFTKASYTTSQVAKNLLGHLAYLLEGLKEVPYIKPSRIRAVTETGAVYDGDYIFGAVSNSKSVAGLIKLKDELVTMDDGMFEVMLIRMPQNVTQLNKLITAISQSTFTSDLIDFFSASHLDISAPADMLWTLDGECARGSASITVDNHPRAIRLVIPKK